MGRLSILAIGLALAATGVASRAEERVDQDVYWKIRQEATSRPQVMQTLHMLTDLYGPRLTGSPNLKAAGEWAIAQMESWGLKNTHLEPWEFGNPGWVNERLSAHVVSPVQDSLVAEVVGWTPGTNGAVRAPAVQVTLPQRPTKEVLTAYFDSIRDRVKGKIVLVGTPQQVQVTFNAPPLRREDRDVQAQFEPPLPAAAPAPPPAPPAPQAAPQPGVIMTGNQIALQLNEFLVASGALVRVNDGGRDHGQIRAFSNTTYDTAKVVPTVVLRNEDYGRIWRLLAGNRAVELEFNIVNRTFPEGRTSYNAIAEIRGSDRADEVVMLGGHLDSWHAATGATDNAVGCAAIMEAARILAAIGVKPRRTIRVALWSGEEQGLRGSRAYVRQHFGTFEEPKAEFEKFAGYFNIDAGTGRVRGMTVFGPPSAATVLREAIAPFKDLGVAGATTTRSRQGANSDYSSFNEAGLPGISISQDPIQYNSYTWHSNLDTYERVIEDDVVKSAIVIAGAVYHLAMRDEPLPRFSKDEMPRRPQPPAPPAAQPTSAQPSPTR